MSAPVEQRHRDAARAWLFAGGWSQVREPKLAQLLADTEAAEAEKSAALRAEFAACVLALRGVESLAEANWCFDEPRWVALRSALSGPLAKEIPDA